MTEAPTPKPRLPAERIYYEIPPWAIPQTCNGCKARIYWITTPKGATCPVDPDGRSHFQTCPRAAEFSKRGRKP